MTLRKLASNRDGAIAIEMAFALPVLITLMMGILQFGLILQASGAMRHGIGEGLRFAKVNTVSDPSDPVLVAAHKSQVETIARDALAGIDRNKVQSIAFTSGVANGAEFGRIDVRYQMQPLIPFSAIPPITINESKTIYLPS